MGCDIHTHAEVLTNGKWVKAGKSFPNRYYREGKPNQIDDDGFEWNGKLTDQPYQGRNYDLFAMLADVRNGHGFAGIKTGEGFNPICAPKGLPENVSKEVQKQILVFVGDGDDECSLSQVAGWCDSNYSEWVEYGKSATSPDYHSASWFTVAELLAYDWDQITMHRGVITLKQYEECKVKDGGQPVGGWSGAISGPRIVTIDEDVADQVLAGNTPPEIQGMDIHVNYHWTEPYRTSAQHFIDVTIPALLSQSPTANPEEVRIVFWFDN